MQRRRRFYWAAAIAPIALLLGVVAAWAIDTGAAGNKVLRNVELAGEDIGGVGSDALLDDIEELDRAQRQRPVRIVTTPEVTYETTAAELGLSIDTVTTAEAALDAGRTAILPARPVGWVAAFFSPREVHVHYEVDVETTRAALRRLEGDALVSPVEPTIELVDNGGFRAVPGRDGSGIDPDALAAALVEAAETATPDAPLQVEVEQSSLAPRLADEVAEQAAQRADELTDEPFTVEAQDAEVEFAPAELRALLRPAEAEDEIGLTVDTEALRAALEDGFADLAQPAIDASFTVQGGVPVLEPAVTGVACCADESVDGVVEALLGGADGAVVELTETEPDLTTAEAEALGIVEEVGRPDEFGPTTRHACCQNRVTNIHRIADLVRGAVILPGETFSVNGFVGRRTIEKGFVADGVIYNGVLTQDVGGGISQFATTLFNASLFAGLEFGEYQSHSLYISRYPRGHEATISWEHPDLQIVNNTPYGVLIWPEYTSTSLTVRLYSTDHVDVAVGSPSPSPQGRCTRWTTPRTRTYEDGSTDDDTVFAVYRPGEGINC